MAKAGYVSIDGTTRKVKSIYVSVDGVARKVKAAYVGVNGVARQWYQSGLPANSLSVGSSVYLNEGGSYVEYLVVNQGLPRADGIYDSSCDGTWLLRKAPWSKIPSSGGTNDYANSGINTWLNGDFFDSLGAIEQAVIKQVKIPYRAGSGTSKSITGGANGLSVKSFLLSGTEVGFTISHMPTAEGGKLEYFRSTRTANDGWGLRSPYCRSGYENRTLGVTQTGSWSNINVAWGLKPRPALILPFTATFDPTTMRLIG